MAADKGRRLVDVGLFVLRLGIGAMFILHGTNKLLGGTEVWQGVGSAMNHFGITQYHQWWGLAAAVTECLGGALLVLGWVTRLASFALLCVMVVASTLHFVNITGFFLKPENVRAWSHPVTVGIVFIALILTGSGSLRLALPKKKAKAPEPPAPAAPKPEAPPTPKPHVQ
jgi:putative oxidoreductase